MDHLYKVRAKLKSPWLNTLPDYTNLHSLIIQMLLSPSRWYWIENTEQKNKKLKSSDAETRKTKTQEEED